jgi:prevent-host-death family protein
MKTIDLSDANRSLASFVRKAGTGPLVVTKAGKPVAALVAVEEGDLETLAVGTSPVFREMITRSRARMRREGGIPEEDVKRMLGME